MSTAEALAGLAGLEGPELVRAWGAILAEAQDRGELIEYVEVESAEPAEYEEST